MTNSADWTEWWAWLDDEGLRLRWRQEFAAVLDHLLAIAVGKESEMSDFYEAAGKHMQEEAADELDRFQCGLLNLIVVLRVSPAKANAPILQA
jgi:hypothetical protein